MNIYTVVEEDYSVKVYTSFPKLISSIFHCELYDVDGKKYNFESFKREMKGERVVRLYEEGASDWLYKVQLHKK